MKSVILFLLLACIVFSQNEYEKETTLPKAPIEPTPSSQPYQPKTKSEKGGNKQYWNDQVRNNMKGQHELTDE